MGKSYSYLKKSLLFTAWVLALAAGFFGLMKYANIAGAVGPSQTRWPSASVLKHNPHRPTLVLFAHPRCPCSQATLGELERMLPALKESIDIKTVFVKPAHQTEDWAQEDLWQKAAALPYVEVVLDQEGKIADQFGALTSGQVFLYDSEGQLVFSGGITPQRGHMGDSDGKNAILGFTEKGSTVIHTAPVFGCALKNPERANVWKVSHEQHHH